MAFEHKSEPLLSRDKYVTRVLLYVGFSFLMLSFSLGIGVVGYHIFNDLSWTDAFLNAAMILTGMGPVDSMKKDVAKWFASCYAIFSGVAFLTTVAVFLSPVVHRFMHQLHLEDDNS